MDFQFRKRHSKKISSPENNSDRLGINPYKKHEIVPWQSKLPLVLATAPVVLLAVVIAGVWGIRHNQLTQSAVQPAPTVAGVAQSLSASQGSTHTPTALPREFGPVNLEAKAAYVWDASNDQALFAKNAYEQLPWASITKVLTAAAASDIFSTSTPITITNQDLAPEGDSGLRIGDIWHYADLRDFMLIVSSNDAAQALADSADNSAYLKSKQQSFIDYMNDKAFAIGLQRTIFHNPSGLDMFDETKSGASGSARDIAHLFEYVIKQEPEIVAATEREHATFQTINGRSQEAHSTNELVNTIPNIIAGKTGYTTLAGGNLAVAFDAGLNHPIVIVVLGSTPDGRFTDVEKLYQATTDYLAGDN
jgi:D-alanyl-D-alanine carboxypeptidase